MWFSRWWSIAWLCLCLIVAPLPAVADSPMDGDFVARDACPVFASIKKQSNPGNVQLAPGQTYQIVSANKPEPSHYLVVVPGANPLRRWVPLSCGERVASGMPAPGKPAAPRAALRTQYVFAISWQPGFCETRPEKPECKSQTQSRFDASHFTLHGLWPDPQYCGVSRADMEADKQGRWANLPAVDLASPTRSALDQAMPGTLSDLERHEWIKHGTCSGETMEHYFGAALHALDAVNNSAVRALFDQQVGKTLTLSDIRSAFDKSFGAAAGERIRLACVRDGNRRIITELTIGLTGDPQPDSDVAGLILAASPTAGGCDSGIVDAVGLQ